MLVGGGLLASSPGCSEQGVGDPCTPEQEYDPTFNGFSIEEVNVESKSFQCRTRVCLVNHFQGRTSCTYGQNADGQPNDTRDGATAPNGACHVPGTEDPITGNTADPADTKKATVPPQCLDRTADKAVYCSCRCADINGQKPGDQTFCDCPDGFACTPLVTSIGQGNEGLTGSYCIKSNTQYDPTTRCVSGECNPTTQNCN